MVIEHASMEFREPRHEASTVVRMHDDAEAQALHEIADRTRR